MVKDVIDKGGVALYIDTEGATNLAFPEMIGCDTSKVVFVDSAKTVEKCFTIVEKFLLSIRASKNPDLFGIVVVDSVSQLSTGEEEEEEGISARGYPIKAKLMSKIMRKLSDIIPQTNVCLCLTNQMMTDISNTSIFADNQIVPTGRAQWYAASTVLRF